MKETITAAERFNQLCNDYNDAARMAIRAERAGTNEATPYENTIASAQAELALFVLMHMDTIRAALSKSKEKA